MSTPSENTKARSVESRRNYYSDRLPVPADRSMVKRQVARFVRHMSNRWRRFCGGEE
jgi:hypothetical protein